ncbi:hypothetical protein DL765_005777 [Monosporascus sp. GIB2]|nr:hypothetical protein DL765_005777 [Monosporascus sp. GIB2]
MSLSIQDKDLLDATKRGAIDKVRKFLDGEADPNAKGDSGSTPLHNAAKGGNPEIAELLLEYGADPNATDDSGSIPLHHAAQGGHDRIVQLLLDYWADPNTKNASGSTPLHNAAEGNNPVVVELLLQSGADREAQDNSGFTPTYYLAQGEIAQQFPGVPGTQKVADPKQATPMIPITINGNTLDHSTKSAADASKTNYILVQFRARLSPSQMQELANAGLKHLDYVSKNTYLCHHEDADLDKIRQMDPVVYVEIYRPEFKITPSLKGAAPSLNYEVDVVFHDAVDSDSEDLRGRIAQESGRNLKDIEFFPHKASLTALGRYLNDIATIDEVYRIEEIGETELRNDQAQLILAANIQPGPTLAQQQVYRGEGQVIAIADTGLDTGLANSVHNAFRDRVLDLYPMNGSAADHHGHGTHVCGSAVGDGWMNDVHVMGTAPQARLVVQCLWDSTISCLKPPRDLTRLFESPYTKHGARVHSNSWGGEMKTDQLPYNRRAEEIDAFVWKHPEMVICWAAGNNAAYDHATGDVRKGQIGAEAAAKNCITVGASENQRPEFLDTYGQLYPKRFPDPTNLLREAGDRSRVAAFSSRGPTKEKRFKPDVVAPGTCILSANSSHVPNPLRPGPHQDWCYKSGTSMATPLVAGCAAVLREALINNGTESPSAALVKALLVNGAEILSRPTPNIHSGFGRVNLAHSIAVVRREIGSAFRDHQLSDTDKSFSDKILVEAQHTTLKATLVWSDPPGKMIKNRLLLELKDASKSMRPPHNSNNVQQVLWNSISPGELTITVGVVGNLDLSPQPFAVVWRLY